MIRHHSSSLRGPRPRPSNTPPRETSSDTLTHRLCRPPGATALSREGRKVFDKPLPNDEERLRAFYDKLADRGSLLVVVDQPAAIEALAVAVSLFNGSNRSGFDGGSDDVEGLLLWERRSIPMGCASEL